VESARTARRRHLADRVATASVAAGGLAVIASILGILVFIVFEVAPLASPATVATERVNAIAGGSALAVLTDEYRQLIAAFDADGHVRVTRMDSGELVADGLVAVVSTEPLPPGAVPPGVRVLTAAQVSGEEAEPLLDAARIRKSLG
jgi:ABC-type uncharacterized transport system permease subunit